MNKNNNNLLKVVNLSKKFGKKQVLHNVSFSISKGEIIGLIGPNGAGKSTIMKCILGIYNFDEGKIILDGNRMDLNNVNQLDNLGSLIEQPALYPFLTGRQHFKLYSTNARDINYVINSLKLGDYLDRKVTEYSLGMKQKLGIALAFVNNPRLVILDEPMNGLDPLSNIDLRKLILSKAKGGVSFIISSHILGELQKIIDRVVLINNGVIKINESLTTIQKKESHYLFLKSNNDFKLINELMKKSFSVIGTAYGLKVSNCSNRITEIFNIIVKNNIKILDISYEKHDLESSIIKILKNM